MAVRGVMPSCLKTATTGELDGCAAGECVLARFAVTRSLRFRKGDFLMEFFCGGGCAVISVLKVLSPVSLLVRSTDVSMAGGFGLRPSRGNLSMF